MLVIFHRTPIELASNPSSYIQFDEGSTITFTDRLIQIELIIDLSSNFIELDGCIELYIEISSSIVDFCI